MVGSIAADVPAISAEVARAQLRPLDRRPECARPPLLPIRRIGHVERARRATTTHALGARDEGFDLHAGLRVAAQHASARDSLERLMRYCARPPLADDRLHLRPDGRVLLMRRAFGYDLLACPRCGGSMALLACILEAIPLAVGAYITAAYWFTASTSFANPAVTLARAASDTFAGIRPADAPGFIVAQLLGAAAATALLRWMVPEQRAAAIDAGAIRR